MVFVFIVSMDYIFYCFFSNTMYFLIFSQIRYFFGLKLLRITFTNTDVAW